MSGAAETPPGLAEPLAADATVLAPPLPAPFGWRHGQIVIALPGGEAVFSTRSGGDLARERHGSELLRQAVAPAPQSWVQDHQVHERHVRVVAAGDAVSAFSTDSDGIATARQDVACVVRTADCVPVALIAPEAVAMLHGGWRGLAAGIVEQGVSTLRELGAVEIRAAIGPHARVCCYEAGDEVHAAFGRLGPGARRGRSADLEQVARALLAEQDVSEVHATGLCTICSHVELLWSHRREGAAAGRQGGLAWRS